MSPRGALVALQRVVDAYPARGAAAKALLRIAGCHHSLGDAARGRAGLERVVRDRSTSEAAARARTLLGSRGAIRRAR